MERPALVASDVDGTLLGVDDAPSTRTCAVLTRMADAGVPLVLATGRPPRWVPAVCDAVGLRGLVVAANGAVLYDAAADRVVDRVSIDPAEVAAVIAAARDAVPDCGIAVELAGGDGGADQFLAEPAYEHAWPNPDHELVDPERLGEQPVVKILVRHSGRSSDDLSVAIGARVGHLVDVSHSASGGLVECSRLGVTKATGLATVAGMLGVAREDVIAFGDMPNDLAMVRWAGHGVAMANAHPDLRAAADEITASNLDDGVASVLERWF